MSKNVYLDIGLEQDEAIERSLRSQIAIRLELLIRDRGLTQAAAAVLFQVPQPTVSKIVNGQLSNISLGYLIRMLIKAGLPFRLERGTSADEIDVAINDAASSVSTNYDEFVLGAALPGQTASKSFAELNVRTSDDTRHG